MQLELFQWVVIALLILLPILYELNNTFKYYAKFFFFYALIFVSGTVLFPFLLVRPRNVENVSLISWWFQNVLKTFGIKPEVRGEENMKSDKPCVIVCNHQSSLDFIGMMEIWPRRCAGLAKKELLYCGPFGVCAYLCGTVFIDRLDSNNARETLAKAMMRLKTENVQLWVFPEGTRNHGGTMLPFKKGAFHIAIQEQIPVVPVVFSSYSEFYSNREKRFGTGKFIVTCLPPVSTVGLTSEDASDLSDRIRRIMLDVFNVTSLETTQVKLSNGVR